MYARVWRAEILPDKVEEITAACRAADVLNRKRAGYSGLVVTRGGQRDSPDCTVVSLWDSLENLRNSETEAFKNTVARRFMVCCKSGATLREEEVVFCDFATSAKKKSATKKRGSRPKRRSR
jgi:heme-degrading monooxygenase HmoA